MLILILNLARVVIRRSMIYLFLRVTVKIIGWIPVKTDDTVDHNSLLDVLEQRFGVTGLALDCLSDRTRRLFKSDASIQLHSSSTTECHTVQPVLGPIKCVVYAEDLPAVVEHHHVDHDLYADVRHAALRSSICLMRRRYSRKYLQMRYKCKQKWRAFKRL